MKLNIFTYTRIRIFSLERSSVQKGQSLMEVLVALGATVIVITAITTVVVKSLQNVQTSRNQDQAGQYAQEGLEYLRQLRSTDYASFIAITNGNHCLDSSLTVQAGNVCLSPTKIINLNNGSSKFVRWFNIKTNDPDCPGTSSKFVTMEVDWAEGYCASADIYCAKSKVVSCLTPFDVLPTL